MRLFRGVSAPFVAIPASVTFASHMFRLNVAWARFCFNFRLADGISLLRQERKEPAYRADVDRRDWRGRPAIACKPQARTPTPQEQMERL